ncbi:uncharacterized protein BT62DRAFT_1003173 [Guyanagaster necrorhizus]|uniref:Zn(2)-C6 fungal-type domain-containing protein n=1 Tax=Guyanagaster necrorhizus TaxID=856835 RepID=A0A9P8AUG6_9AGAR|nr:uncharacterized protein BT62DRAFT_1003173 [Guyanagaster necrorhizus MCA 3950]KAG7448458.1 hypothetical protein BT62DRAFT_1003173 [Guyanagaster necrorhizus MCA 3950]
MASSSRRSNTSSRAPQLHKGGACLNCRHRKIRCDGRQPKCGQCAASTIFHECEYYGQGMTKTRMLEEQISTVERRIRELENARQASPGSPIILTQPYNTLQPSQGNSRNEQPKNMPVQVHQVMWTFLRHCAELGFFLYIPHFVQSATSSNLVERPVAALLSAAYLWGIHLSPSPDIVAWEGLFLAQAVNLASQGLANCPSHPYGVIQCIQAEVLLAQYFFRNLKMLEGKYHTSAAVSLVLSSGLHKIRSQSGGSGSILREARDAIEEGERLNGLWTVVILNNSWTAVDGSPSNLSEEDSTRIDAPWPLDINDYSKLPHPLDRTSHTIHRFMRGEADAGTSILALHTKASILFEQASLFKSKLHPGMNSTQVNHFKATFTSFSNVLERFIERLPTLQAMLALSTPATAIMIHTLVHATVITLHLPVISLNPNSVERMDKAALAITQVLSAMNITEFPFLDAILGVLWSAACRFLIGRVSSVPQPQQAITQQLLQMVIGALTVVSPTSAFVDYELRKLRGN